MAWDEWRRVARVTLCFCSAIVGCAPRSEAESPARAEPRSEGEQAESLEAQDARSTEEGERGSVDEPARSDAPRSGPLDDRRPDPSRSLPEISVRHIGMHVGGGTNTAEEKKPLLTALERKNTELLGCYKFVSRPLAGGTFGADLYVKSAGGRPEVRATRQKLGDEGFDGCMRQVLGSVEFPRLERPTVVSYSLRFDVRDPTAP